jgi:hypothetical protein
VLNQVKQDALGLDEIFITKVAKGILHERLSASKKSNPIIEIFVLSLN